ncbi:venom acid phosphatase Acph-1-like [Rhynchophorus ferrugineus]|uniref:venom acid phosphatase Acph-1-like n=1 Tax=Rhynchophorus ferrugineus TaxID=354439 RepID=UPI003FCC7031
MVFRFCLVTILPLVLLLSDGYIINPKTDYTRKTVRVTADSSLILTHVIFRHGNRTPEYSERYPNDPYLNKTYYPYGIGQLTNFGKKREYSIGTALRERYDNFLGEYYQPNIIESRSTDRNRTKMSLLLVLASLFPPKCRQVWNGELDWQPIPYNYVPEKYDSVLYGISCPNYKTLYTEVLQSPEVLADYNQYAENFSYIAEHSGLNITKIENVYDLYFGLATEEEYGLTLPEWTQKVWPEFINEIAFKQYEIYTKTTDLKRIAAGYLIEKIIQDTELKINNATETKMYLYSAHENNIGQLFQTLNLFEYHHVPTYGSYVLFEVHWINNTYGFKIYYQNYISDYPKLLKLPACEEFCSLDTFKTLVDEYLPTPGLCGI